MSEVIAFCEAYKLQFLAVHILGVSLGLGGATIADTFFFRFLKDFRISGKEADVMQWMSKVILTSLFIIYISGAALYMSDMEKYLHSPAFLFKMCVVFVLTVNGIALHEFVSPRLVHISFLKVKKHVPKYIHRLRKIAFAMGAISVTSWYTAFFTAMLKSALPENVTFKQLFLGYIFALGVAICVSQLVESQLHKKSAKK